VLPGAFAFEGVPAGTLSLVVRHAEWPLTVDGPFATVAGETTMRIVAVLAGARLTGTALDAQGVPVPGVKIARESVEIAGVQVPGASTTTDAAGRFLFPGLATARYWVHGSGPLADGSFVVWSRHVDVAGNDVDLQLAPAGNGAIECELLPEGDLPETIGVRIWRPAGSSDEGTFSATVTGSRFVVRGLPAGEFRVVIDQEHGGTMKRGEGSVTVTAGATAKIRIAVTSHRLDGR